VLSQVHLILVLPSPDGPREVSCDGAVVRCAKDGGAKEGAVYETAIFFTRVEDDDRMALDEYVAILQARHRVA
jgi:hypothetical protein